MVEDNSNEIAPEDTGEGTSLSHTKGRKAFRRLRRELTDDELSSPAVQRLLLDDIERLEKENSILADYQSSFHEADKQVAIQKEKLKTNIAHDVVFGVCLTIGAALIGFAPSIWQSQKPDGIISLSLGALLIIGGIASKVVKR